MTQAFRTTNIGLEDFIYLLGISSVTALVGLWVFAHMSSNPKSLDRPTQESSVSMLFRGANIEHASYAARHILAQKPAESDWSSLYQSFSARFPLLPRKPFSDGENVRILPAQDMQDVAVLKIEQFNGCTHVHLVDPSAYDLNDHHQLKSQKIELNTLRVACSAAPYPAWLVTNEGEVGWHNSAYETLYRSVNDCEPDKTYPLFKSVTPAIEANGQTRASLKTHDEKSTLWFDVCATDVEGGMMFHALDINAVIRAEIAQRNFVQTLAKTFAQLSIGLAIFDRNGKLALFNPSLIDLTALPAEFLSARPDLSSFFDRLRDNRVMPEPKNYMSWRQEIADVISAATDGRYEETWSLENGQTYRVTGRPHPDGAIAFLIEDISAEILVTRNFRAELELSQSLMDTFDDALVVFSSAGLLQFCNASYRDMWKLDPENSFAQVSIVDSIRDWQKQCLPNPAWGDIRDFVMNFEERAHWDTQIVRSDHSLLRCYIDPIASGATLIRFESVTHVQTRSGKTGKINV